MHSLAGEAFHGLIRVVAILGAVVREPALHPRARIGTKEQTCPHGRWLVEAAPQILT